MYMKNASSWRYAVQLVNKGNAEEQTMLAQHRNISWHHDMVAITDTLVQIRYLGNSLLGAAKYNFTSHKSV